MVFSSNIIRRTAIVAGLALAASSLAACGAGGDSGKIEITYSTNNDEQTVANTEKLVAAFMEKYPDITVSVDTHPAGTEGDNLTKTKLATGEMQDVFLYNTGSLFQVLQPDQTLVNLADESWQADVTDDFKSTVSTEAGVYGAPIGNAFAGGVLYNKKIYEQLGLEVPTSWDEFMENSRTIQSELPDVTPVIQAYGDDWTAQLWLLADFANVDQQDPDWAEKYTANEAKYVDEPAFAGFAHQQEAAEAGFFNEDFLAINNDQALKLLAEGSGAQYPMLTAVIGAIAANYPDNLNDIGYFAMPADDPEYTAATVWQPSGLYIPTTTEGAEARRGQAVHRVHRHQPRGLRDRERDGRAQWPVRHDRVRADRRDPAGRQRAAGVLRLRQVGAGARVPLAGQGPWPPGHHRPGRHGHQHGRGSGGAVRRGRQEAGPAAEPARLVMLDRNAIRLRR